MRGGTVVDGQGIRRADVAVEGNTVSAVGDLIVGPDDHVIDCRGRYVLPGFVDTHSDADRLMEDESVQRSLLVQGVTTVIAGHDGVPSHRATEGARVSTSPPSMATIQATRAAALRSTSRRSTDGRG